MDSTASGSLSSFVTVSEDAEFMLSRGSENLCQQIWSFLPNDAIERVMLQLPMRSLLRARSVCKAWNSAIGSKSFTDLYAQVANYNAWLLVFPNNDTNAGLAYDSSLRSWFVLPFSFLPFASKVAAAAQGLVCLIPRESCHKEWIICNPITHTWEGIPCPPGLLKLFFRVIGLLVADDGISFKVVIAGSELVAEDSEQFILTTEVYDSSSHHWRKGGSMLLDAPLSRWKAASAGRMFCVTGSLPYKVLAYDVRHGFWFEVKAPLPENLTAANLVDSRGQLLLVGGIGQNGITSTIGIWRLNPMGTGWIEVGWMPTHHCNDLLRSLSRRFVCIGHGNFLYFSNKKCHGILEHNMLYMTWEWIPISPSFVNIHYYMLRGFHFQPRLQI